MVLRALRPSTAVVKVMSVPGSRCIRVVTPDDHVNIGFHEILLHQGKQRSDRGAPGGQCSMWLPQVIIREILSEHIFFRKADFGTLNIIMLFIIQLDL